MTTQKQLDEAAFNVYAALRHLTLAQVASVSDLTVGQVVQHALGMKFVDDDAAWESAAGGADEAPATRQRHAEVDSAVQRRRPVSSKKRAKSIPAEDFDDIVLGIIEGAGNWIGMGEIQDDPKMAGINVQRTRRSIKRLAEGRRLQHKGNTRTRVYKAA